MVELGTPESFVEGVTNLDVGSNVHEEALMMSTKLCFKIVASCFAKAGNDGLI